MFENIEIPLDQLPSVTELEWQALDPAYKKRLLVDRMITIAVMTALVVFSAVFPKFPPFIFPILGSGVLIASIVMLIWPFIVVPRSGYVVRDKDIVYKTGVFYRSVTAIPFNRIQHVETSSSPLDRRFDLASLKLFTAGGTGGDLKIDGLNAERAEQLRALVLEKAGASIEAH